MAEVVFDFNVKCAPREAGYVLRGILDNDTVLPIREHTSDTHGFTEHLFGFCALLGIAFMPRLKDLPDQVLSRIDRTADYGALQPLLRGRINVELILEQWDQLVRLAASLKDRLTPAHVVMQRLANANASDRLAGALTQLGRLMKTVHILRYIQEAPLRDAIQLQLNRGEFRHILAKSLFVEPRGSPDFANQGGFRSGDYEEVMNKASCFSLLSNAVLVWNTVHIAGIVDQLRAAGHEVRVEELARVSPLAHAHVIPNGSYFQPPRRRTGAAPEPVMARARGARMPNEDPVNWQPVSEMPLIASMIDGALEDTREHLETLAQARTQPHRLDDATLGRTERVHAERLEFVGIYAQQISRWRAERLSAGQARELDRMEAQNGRLRTVTADVLALGRKLRRGTIERVLGMNDVELGLQALLEHRQPGRR